MPPQTPIIKPHSIQVRHTTIIKHPSKSPITNTGATDDDQSSAALIHVYIPPPPRLSFFLTLSPTHLYAHSSFKVVYPLFRNYYYYYHHHHHHHLFLLHIVFLHHLSSSHTSVPFPRDVSIFAFRSLRESARARSPTLPHVRDNQERAYSTRGG